MQNSSLTQADIDFFRTQGYLVVRKLAPADLRADILAAAQRDVAACVEPVEFEGETHYPGAPASVEAEGGRTIRRLRQVYPRDEAFRRWAHHPSVTDRVKALLGSGHIALTQAHHNSLMTKQPAYSSITQWHRDIRYWSFEDSNLVSVWLALGSEVPENGSLGFLPGSHLLDLDADRFENRAFLRNDLPENKPLIDSAIFPTLEPGDVVFFHAMTFHAAGWNRTDQTKYSLVFGYHRQDNRPIAGTRSASLPTILID